jgi:toxin-antitoxin system, toxin component, relE family
MESKWGYQLTKKADADLDNIVEYIAVELANPEAASHFMDKLQGVIEETRSFPESGSLVNNEFIPDTEVRKKLIDNYIMYYLPDFDEKLIYILRIVYSRQNIDEIIRQLNA